MNLLATENGQLGSLFCLQGGLPVKWGGMVRGHENIKENREDGGNLMKDGDPRMTNERPGEGV